MKEEGPSLQDVVSRRMKQVFVIFAIIGVFFIVAEHRAHLIPYLPWLFLAACPLMHVFMHHGHGRHHHSTPGESEERPNGVPGTGYPSPPGPGYTSPPGTSQARHGDRP